MVDNSSLCNVFPSVFSFKEGTYVARVIYIVFGHGVYRSRVRLCRM